MSRPEPKAADASARGGGGALDALYQDCILERFRRPAGKGALPAPDAVATAHNPLCGEHVTVMIAVDRTPAGLRVRDLRFQSDGCSITQASASMMTDLARGRTATEIRELATRLGDLVRGDPAAAEDATLGPALPLAVVARVPARISCATLGWRALAEALDAAAGSGSPEAG